MRQSFHLCSPASFAFRNALGVRSTIARAGGTVCTTVTLITLCGFSFAGQLQLMSVKETSPGAVTATVGVRTGGTPNASDFQLLLDGKNEIKAGEVKPASSSLLETSVILCVDQSGSMGPARIKQLQDAIRSALVKPEGGRLSLALWAFDSDVTKLHDFSENAEELSKAAGKIGLRSARDNQTKLYEAIALGLSELRNYPKNGPKRLILMTDGKDDGSSITEQVVVNEANAQSVIIDAIGFGNVSDHDANLLARLAKSAGGYFTRVNSADQLSRELQKLLSLPPPRVFDVNFHYKASGEADRAKIAQLKFTAAGQPPILLNIQQTLSALQSVSSDRKESQPDKEKNSDLSILLWIMVGLLAIVGVYLLGRSKSKEEVKHEITPEPTPAPPPASTEPEPVKRPRTMVAFMFPPPAKGQPAAYLDGISGKARGEQFPIEQKVTHIGAGDDNDLRMDDEYVSRKHAAIRYDSGGLYLNDSGSRNGTFLNGAELHHSAMALAPGDQIRVGKTTFRVRARDSQAPRRPDKGPGTVTEPTVP
ncbi:MAG TPA: FHA domain-containing protein [Nitrosospira sp.]|nr:FHA domain-containing protein [Nitrosospira sp.]